MRIFILFLYLFSAVVVSAEVLSFKSVAAQSSNLILDSQTKVEKLGKLQNGFIVYNYTREFNKGMRASNRLVIARASNELVGIYSINDWATYIKHECIFFPYSVTEGNSICLSNGKLPKVVWLSGENSALFQ